MASSGDDLLRNISIILTTNVIMIVRREIELTMIMTNITLMIMAITVIMTMKKEKAQSEDKTMSTMLIMIMTITTIMMIMPMKKRKLISEVETIGSEWPLLPTDPLNVHCCFIIIIIVQIQMCKKRRM